MVALRSQRTDITGSVFFGQKRQDAIGSVGKRPDNLTQLGSEIAEGLVSKHFEVRVLQPETLGVYETFFALLFITLLIVKPAFALAKLTNYLQVVEHDSLVAMWHAA